MRNSAKLPIQTLFALLLLFTAGGCSSVGALNPLGRGTPSPERQAVESRKTLERGAGKFVVVDLDANELRFMDGEQVLWAAPVGTGTGLQLRGSESEYDFSTPNGTFQVQYKELEPVWIKPDWYYIKNELPIPAVEAKERRVPGGLGAAAVYLGDEIAIHGTDKPELLGQRVSHGCIRLLDANALRLFHNVQVGTPVVIVGGASLVKRDIRDSAAVVPTNPGKPRPKPKDPLLEKPTADLLALLDRQIERADTSDAWTHTAHLLMARGLDDDAIALRGLLRRAGRTETERFEREYATFLADAFSRGSLRAVVSLARIGDADRDRAARAIVDATMGLYSGALEEPGAPWPTRRAPTFRLGPEGTKGWEALAAAEKAYRNGETPSTRIVLESAR